MIRALRTLGPGQAELEHRPPPWPRSGEVAIDVSYVGLCASDRAIFSGSHPYLAYPRVQGHEFSGRVAAVGPDCPPWLSPGRQVVVDPVRGCGSCTPCRNGSPNACPDIEVLGVHTDGSLQEQVVVDAAATHDAHALPLDVAALAEPVAVGLHAVGRADVRRDDRVVILGAGPIGLSVAHATVQRGAAALVIDRSPERLRVATATGASAVIDASTSEAIARALEWSGGEGPRVVLDATGSAAAVRTAFELVVHTGTIGIVGVSTDLLQVPVVAFSRKELNVVGCRNSAGEFPSAVAALGGNPDLFRRWLTDTIGLVDVPGALRSARRRAGEIKTLVHVPR